MDKNPAIISDAVFQASPTKETEYSGFGKHDYVVNGEITVTITLAEYRMLLTDASKAKANAEYLERRKAETERDALKKDLEAAKSQIADLRALIGSAAKKEETANE